MSNLRKYCYACLKDNAPWDWSGIFQTTPAGPGDLGGLHCHAMMEYKILMSSLWKTFTFIERQFKHQRLFPTCNGTILRENSEDTFAVSPRTHSKSAAVVAVLRTQKKKEIVLNSLIFPWRPEYCILNTMFFLWKSYFCCLIIKLQPCFRDCKPNITITHLGLVSLYYFRTRIFRFAQIYMII